MIYFICFSLCYFSLGIVLNELTQVDSSCFFYLFFNWIFFSISSFNIRSIENWASWSILIYFIWGYLSIMIRFAGFGILTPVKLRCFILRCYFGFMTWITGPSTLNFLFTGLSSSHDSCRKFDGLIELTHFFPFF
jgi:hypothetical protein